MKKIKDYLSFIPSVIVITAIVIAIFSYKDGETSKAIAKISSVQKAFSEEYVRAASETTTDNHLSEKKSSVKKSIRIGKKKIREESATTAEPAATIVKKSASIKPENEYRDGTYTGTGTGFNGGTTTARVTIRNGKIASVSFTNQDTAQFFDKAAAVLTPAILSNGSKSVDTVSGATYSSNGIIESVNNALKKAGKNTVSTDKSYKSAVEKKSGQKKGTVPTDTDKKKTPHKKPAKVKDVSLFIPGTYRASAVCGPDPKMPLWDAYTIEFDVKIDENGSITTTRPEGTKGFYEEDDGYYLDRASDGMIPSLTSQDFFDRNQSLITGKSSRASTGSSVSGKKINMDDIQVDTVSGATYSSKAIKEAFVNALRQAVNHE